MEIQRSIGNSHLQGRLQPEQFLTPYSLHFLPKSSKSLTPQQPRKVGSLEELGNVQGVSDTPAILDGRVGTAVEEEAHHRLRTVASCNDGVGERRPPVVGQLALGVQRVHVEPEVVDEVLDHGHPDRQRFRVPAAPGHARAGVVQGARAKPGTVGTEQGEGGDRAAGGDEFEKRPAAKGVRLPVLDRGAVVETPAHQRLVPADLLQETLARPNGWVALVDVPATVDEDLEHFGRLRCADIIGQTRSDLVGVQGVQRSAFMVEQVSHHVRLTEACCEGQTPREELLGFAVASRCGSLEASCNFARVICSAAFGNYGTGG